MNGYLTWLAEVLEQASLKVAEVPGWRTRGRGPFGPVWGVMCHHTVGSLNGNMPSLRVITEGRIDLAGPLCQLGLGRDGTWYVVAAGTANHAGRGNWQNHTMGNTGSIGIEAENNGTTEKWPDAQMDAYRHGCAALLKKLGVNAIMCCGHKEYALPPGRKIDPNFDMSRFRMDVAAIMAGAAPLPSVIPKVDDNNRPTLRRGDRGEAVKLLQEKLSLDVDGRFGPLTEAAVRAFQRKHPPLVPDGIVGPKTWSALVD